MMARTPKTADLETSTTRKVKVAQWVEVTIDESKFDEKFMSEFRDSFYQFHSIQEHVEHLAQMIARRVYFPESKFIEGYGLVKEMGISFKMLDSETETEIEP